MKTHSLMTLAAVILLSTIAMADAPSTQPDPAGLDKVLPEVAFDQVGLSDVVDFLHDIAGVKIDVKWDVLTKAGVDQSAPISVKMSNVKVRDALDLILKQAGTPAKVVLEYRVVGDAVQISTHDDFAARDQAGK